MNTKLDTFMFGNIILRMMFETHLEIAESYLYKLKFKEYGFPIPLSLLEVIHKSL